MIYPSFDGPRKDECFGWLVSFQEKYCRARTVEHKETILNEREVLVTSFSFMFACL